LLLLVRARSLVYHERQRESVLDACTDQTGIVCEPRLYSTPTSPRTSTRIINREAGPPSIWIAEHCVWDCEID
jgi:hypothetical protein